MNAVQELPLSAVTADPGQPRQIFDEAALRELASSIRANGLLQPITVRANENGGFWVVAGERRFRAHQILGVDTIRALVIVPTDSADVRIKQIIENDNRVDVTPLEQARSYAALMEAQDWSPEQLAARIGKSATRINERTALLKLRPEYQRLVETGGLKPLEAQYLARLSPRAQDVLFRAIRDGRCKTANDLRAQAFALVDAEAQGDMMPTPEPPTDCEKRAVRSFETMVAQVAAMLNDSVRDNQIVALRKVNKDRAGQLADLFAAMQKDMRRIEVALRTATIQADLLSAAA